MRVKLGEVSMNKAGIGRHSEPALQIVLPKKAQISKNKVNEE
jgi:hypothetical protein